jgi:hypothetical protein
MISFTVVWHKLALDELAEIWLAAPDREAVSYAANWIDQQLARDPFGTGAQVSERSRELSVPPLHILFRIREADRIVEVFAVEVHDFE